MPDPWSERIRKSGHGGLPNLGLGGTIVTVIVSSFFAAIIADDLFVILAFGPHAFFTEGLRVTNWKHGVLSTGVKLSGIPELLRGALDFLVWTSFIFAIEWVAGFLRRAVSGTRWLLLLLRLLGGAALWMFAFGCWERGFSGMHPIPLSAFLAAIVLIWKGITRALKPGGPESP